MNNAKVEFKIIKNSKNKKTYSIKLSPADNFLTIYVFGDESDNCIKVIRISKKWLLKEIISNLES